MPEHLDDLHDDLLTAANRLNVACLGLIPLERLSKVTMWQWGAVQEAQEAVTEVMERVEWALRKKGELS